MKGTEITEYQALILSEKELILMRAGKDVFMPLSSASFPIGCDLFTVSFSMY